MGEGLFEGAKLYIDGKEISGIKKLEIAEPTEDNKCKGLMAPLEGSMTFKGTILGLDKFKRLYGILKHTKKTRTKKKLFNRIYKKWAGIMYLQAMGKNNG